MKNLSYISWRLGYKSDKDLMADVILHRHKLALSEIKHMESENLFKIAYNANTKKDEYIEVVRELSRRGELV